MNESFTDSSQGSSNKKENVTTLKYVNELGLIKAFFKLNILKNPDITVGYNIFGFDDKYIRIRTDIYRYNDNEIDELEKL